MEHKSAIFGNKGMFQDTSISKSSNELAFENYNVRITAREDGTLFAVTNEKGLGEAVTYHNDKQNDLFTYYGSCSFANKIALFLQADSGYSEIVVVSRVWNEIYSRWELDLDNILYSFDYNDAKEEINLDFSAPIEAIYYYEREDIQKIYWVDGIHPCRVINIVASDEDKKNWDETSFDFVPVVEQVPTISVEKQYGGSGKFPSGVIQYFVSLYNKFGQESKIIQASDINYISFEDRGAKEDETVNCNFKITLGNLDTSFDYVRVYSAKRTAIDGPLDVHIVTDTAIPDDGTVEVIDTNISQEAVDANMLYFIGGDSFIASTLEQKDDVAFFGNLEVNTPVLTANQKQALQIFFNENPIVSSRKQISNELNTENYSYKQQLLKSSSNIKGFKSGEWYRIGIQFQDIKGQWTDPVWIQDIEITSCPYVSGNSVNIASLYWGEYGVTIQDISEISDDANLQAYRFVMVETNNDNRSILAQGIINPTVFNMQERCEGTIYSETSWISRPFNSLVHHAHMDSLGPNNNKNCEIQSIQTAKDPFGTSNNSVILLLDRIDQIVLGTIQNNLYVYLFEESRPTADIVDDYTNTIQQVESNGDYTEVDRGLLTELNKSWKTFYNELNSWLVAHNYNISMFFTKTGFQELWNNWMFSTQGTSNEVATNIPFFNNDSSGWANVHNELNSRFWLQGKDNGYKNPEQYYIDSSIATINSPEITFGSLVDVQNKKVRITGLVNISDYYRQYVAEFENYGDDEAYLEDVEKENNLQLISEYLLHDDTIDPNDGKTLQSVKNHMIYLFQKHGSAIGQTSLNTGQIIPYSNLKHKIFANYLYSNKTAFLTLANRQTYIPKNISLSNENVIKFSGDRYHKCDYTKLVATVNPYKIQYGDGTSLNLDQYDPVYIKAKQTPHVVFELTDYGTTTDILPGCLNINVQDESYGGDQGRALYYWEDIYKTWENLLDHTDDNARNYYWDNNKHYRMNADYNSECYFTPNFANTAITQGDEFLFLGEIYKNDIADADALYGDHTDENILKKHKWIPITKTHLISDGDLEIYPSEFEGDTYFQRWECLRTYPVTEEDENSVVDIVSFMVETHINLDGRDDINRGPFNLTTKRPTNTNLLNTVYSQNNNIFEYNINDLSSEGSNVVTKFDNQFVWSLAKSPIQQIDPWTNVTLSALKQVRGEYGPINEITKLGDTLIVFQDKAICTIDFNNRTQISTEQGVPIELANSGKVNGISYVSTLYGCKNKHTIINAKTGIYFIDNINKSFMNVSKEGIKDISTSCGMSVWFRNNLNDSIWEGGPVDTAFVCKYDSLHGDIYIINKNTCLVFNEYLQTFTSFFDYKDCNDLYNVEGNIIYFANTKANKVNIYKMFSGNYLKDYSVTYKINPEPYSDKIFTNIELIADRFTANANIDSKSPSAKLRDLPFNKLRAWNEYQDTGEIALAEDKYQPSSFKDKFRIRHIQLPRCTNSDSKYKLDRLRNPWIFLELKNDVDSTGKLVYHSMVTHYYE